MSSDDKAVVHKITDASEKVTNVFSQWWNLTTQERRPQPDSKRMTTVRELPIYAEDEPRTQYKFIPEDPLPLQREFSCIRHAFNTEYDRVVSRFSFVDRAVNKASGAANKINSYVQDEWTVLPKAGAITVGGMAGFVLGLKRGSFGRVLTTATGLATMAAFCYPHETVDVVRTGVAHAEQKWNEFQESPEPESKKKVDLSPPK
ncbi:unnamed protein product [Auanema sp. JU1783]|nr:unnamed protein product [Auanema sp. JU1783]